MKIIDLTEMDFTIKKEYGIAAFTIIPKDPNIKKILFYSLKCKHCREYLSEKKINETIYGVNLERSKYLSTHFKVTRLPAERIFD